MKKAGKMPSHMMPDGGKMPGKMHEDMMGPTKKGKMPVKGMPMKRGK